MQRWDKTEPALMLFTPEEFARIPDGVVLECISGDMLIKGVDFFDDNTRFGYLAYGSRHEDVQAVARGPGDRHAKA